MRLRRRSRLERARATAEEHPDLTGGLVVVVAVTALLEALHFSIGHRANTQITHLWIAGRQLSRNVVGAHLLRDTDMQARKLVQELEQHVETPEEVAR